MAVRPLPRGIRLRRAVAVPAPEVGTPTVGEEPAVGTGQPGGGWRSHLGSLGFLAPGAIWLALITIYPLVATLRDSFYNDDQSKFIGTDNYKTIFSTNDILLTFRNNVIWLLVFPFFVTFFGLVFAVLTERIRWSTAFKTVIFMPIVFSATASALVWRTAIFDIDPHIGAVNSVIQTVSDWFHPPGLYAIDTSAGQSVSSLARSGVQAGPDGTLQTSSTVSPGGTAKLGLAGIAFTPARLQLVGAKTAVEPAAAQGAITGVVWRDFSPSHPTQQGQVFSDEDGIPGLRLSLLRSDGSGAGSTSTNADGSFRFDGVDSGSYRVQIDANNFQAGFTGIFWLGTQSVNHTDGLSPTAQALLSVPLVDLAMIVAYLWMWAGFSMVVIGAGLAALNREVLEAAQIDGANEWQTFRRVTMPMLAPVLVVVFVTMIINVLKIFDIILNMAPGSSQGDANTLALAMYNYGFGSSPPAQGLASAIAVILFILVIPAMIANLRRIQG